MRPRHLHHPGVVETSLVWVDARTVSIEQAQRRILVRWTAGCRLEAAPSGYLFHLATPVIVDTRQTEVVPLLEQRGRWSTTELARADLGAFPPGAVLRLEGGSLTRPTLTPTHPADWLDVTSLQCLEVQPLGHPPSPPVLAAAPLAFDPRKQLGVGAEAANLAALAGALKNPLPLGGPLRGLMRSAAAGLLGSAAAGMGALGQVSRPFAPAASFLERMAERMGVAGLMGRIVGEQHLRYMQRMMAMFDSQNWADALRHAIPLSNVPERSDQGGGGWLSWLSAGAFGQLTGPSTGGGRSVTVGGGLFEMLKELYRRAFRALDAQGKVKDAAYVLAELLDEPMEAVLYLEKHGELKLAAEFAETKGLDAGLVVLLWFRAGDVPRATALATLREAFAAGVRGLEDRNLTDEARALRMQWADREVRAGAYAAAADIVWPYEDLRELARDWLKEAMNVPGAAGAHALVRYALLCPNEPEVPLEALKPMLQAEGRTGRILRKQLAQYLEGSDAGAARWLMRPLVRELMRDAAAFPNPTQVQVLRRQLPLADPVMAQDLPKIPTSRIAQPPALDQLPETLYLAIEDGDVGTVAIHDVVGLPNDRWLVALGELGVRVITSTGRTIRRYATPAHHLVRNHAGTRVIVVADRGAIRRLARLNAQTLSMDPWCDATIDQFAGDFDGRMWFVTEGDRVSGLDAQAPGLRALWSVPDLNRILAIRHDNELEILTHVPTAGVELFRYRIPQLTLASRKVLAVAGVPAHAAAPNAVLVDDTLTWFEEDRGLGASVEVGDNAPITALHHDPVFTAVVGQTIDVWSHRGKLAAVLTHEGTTGLRARLIDFNVLCFDSSGRLRVIDRTDASIRVDLRL